MTKTIWPAVIIKNNKSGCPHTEFFFPRNEEPSDLCTLSFDFSPTNLAFSNFATKW